MLWMVPLSLLVGERVGWRGVAGALLGLAGIVVLVDPPRFDWSDRAVSEGHVWLLLAGFTWAIAILMPAVIAGACTPLDVLPWQMSRGDGAAVDRWRRSLEPARLSRLQPSELWIALLYIGVLAGPTGDLGRRLGGRALPPVTGSLGMLGMPLLGIASSVVLLGEPITCRWRSARRW